MTHPTPTAPTRAEIDEAAERLNPNSMYKYSAPDSQHFMVDDIQTIIQAAKSGGARFTEHDLINNIYDFVGDSTVCKNVIRKLIELGVVGVRS